MPSDEIKHDRRRFVAGLGATLCAPGAVLAQPADPPPGECVVMPLAVMPPPVIGGGGAWSPIGQPWLLALYRADVGVLNTSDSPAADGELVQTWEDQSGLARHATPLVASYRPTFIAADSRADGLPSLGPTVNAAPQGLTTASISNIAAVYATVSYNDGVDNTFDDFVRLMSSTSDNTAILGFSGAATLFAASGNFTAQLEKNGNASSNTVLPMPLSVCVGRGGPYSGRLNMGTLAQNGRTWTGGIFGFAFTDGTESAADSERMVGWLAHEAGIQARLAAGHPYRDAPP